LLLLQGQQKESGKETSQLAKDGLQGSSKAGRFIALQLVEEAASVDFEATRVFSAKFKKMLRTMTFHQILFLTWLKQGCV
jgi:hypothetical protein